MERVGASAQPAILQQEVEGHARAEQREAAECVPVLRARDREAAGKHAQGRECLDAAGELLHPRAATLGDTARTLREALGALSQVTLAPLDPILERVAHEAAEH